MMPNTIAYHLQTGTQSIQNQHLALLLDNSPIYMFGMMFSGRET